MPLFRTYCDGDFLLGIWKTEESVEQLCAMLHHPSLWEDAYRKFTSEHRRLEWLSVRVLLQRLVGEGKDIAYYPSGKPYLKDGMHISISHTRGYVAIALHPDNEVGVDIEQYGDRVKRVASRFIHPDEEDTMQQGDEIYALLLHWSAKETLFKIMGEEEVDFIRHLRIMPFVPSAEGAFDACEFRTPHQCRYTIQYFTHPDFVLTWTMSQK